MSNPMTIEDWCAAWTQADNKLRELTLAARALVHEIEVTSNYTSPDLQAKLSAVNRIVWPASEQRTTSASNGGPDGT